MPDDTAFLIEGTKAEGANRLSGAKTITVEPAAPIAEPTYASHGVSRERVEWAG
jgi:hypothetical protein